MLPDAELNRHFATFGDYLRFLRERAELTQREFGQAVNYSDSMINRLERNLRPPNLAVVIARFIPALHLEDAPHLSKRLIELAEQARPTDPPSSTPPVASGTVLEAVPNEPASHDPSVGRDPFVGREREMAEARGRLQKALMGDGQILIFSGEPGIGKTRLSNEIMARGVPLFQTFTSEAYAEGSPPYTAVTQLVRQVHSTMPKVIQSLPPMLLAELMTCAPDLRTVYAAAVPTSALPMSALPVPSTPADALTQQQNLIDSVVALCEALAAERPFIWRIEDVHWADSGSLTVLRQLARRLRKQPVVLIVTHREAEIDEAAALREVLADMYRERNLLRIRLSRLNQDHTRALLHEVLPEADAKVIDAIYRDTEGNPFFIAEMGKAWREAREAGGNLDAGTLPTTLRETIQARVKKLPTDAQTCLQLAATVGREFDFDLLAGASDLDPERLQAALEVAERTQMISQVPASSATLLFAFAHALIPSALQESLSGVQRQRQHLRVAQTIERLRPEQWESLAYHFRGGGQTHAARGYALRAGDRARAAYAQVEAERSYKSVLVLNPTPAERAYALSQMADAIGAQGRYDEARRCAEDALQLYRTLNDWDGAARAYSQAIYSLWMAAKFQRGYEMARDGLAELAAHPVTPAVGQLYYQAARAHEMNGRYDDAAPLLQTALAIAEQQGQIELRAQTLISIGKLKHLQRRYREAEPAFREALEVAERHGLIAVAAAAHEHMATTLIDHLARMSEARDHYLKAADLARRGGLLSDYVNHLQLAANTSLQLGEFDEAEKQLAVIREWMNDLPDSGKVGMDLEFEEAFLLRCRGDLDEASQRLQELYERGLGTNGYPQYVSRDASLALFDVWLELEQLDRAEQVALGGVQLDEQNQQHFSVYVIARLCSVRAFQKRVPEARSLLQQVRFQTVGEASMTDQINLSICEARVARCEGNWVEALNLYQQTIHYLSLTGLVCRRARTLVEWATMYIERDQAGDKHEAEQLLLAALKIFKDIWATGYIKRVQSQLNELKSGAKSKEVQSQPHKVNGHTSAL